MSRQMSRFEDEKVARLASILEDAENALYCPSPHEAQLPLAERNRAVAAAQVALTKYMGTLLKVPPDNRKEHL